jgi:hypothetical protein
MQSFGSVLRRFVPLVVLQCHYPGPPSNGRASVSVDRLAGRGRARQLSYRTAAPRWHEDEGAASLV